MNLFSALTRFRRPFERRAWENLLGRLATDPAPYAKPLKDALQFLRSPEAAGDDDWICRIELERRRLLTRAEPLDDGSLGAGGLYDSGVSIREACEVSVTPAKGRLLYQLVRSMRPRRVLELGTNVGISSSFLAAGLIENGQGGTLVSLDASVYRQRIATDVHRRLGIDNVSCVNGRFSITLRPTLAEAGTIDLAFIDGHHQYRPTLAYFDEILSCSSPDALFIFDDIRWSSGMKKAWSKLKSDRRLGLMVDLTSVGLALRRVGSSPRFASGRIDLSFATAPASTGSR